jgi:hypothetical protein
MRLFRFLDDSIGIPPSIQIRPTELIGVTEITTWEFISFIGCAESRCDGIARGDMYEVEISDKSKCMEFV